MGLRTLDPPAVLFFPTISMPPSKDSTSGLMKNLNRFEGAKSPDQDVSTQRPGVLSRLVELAGGRVEMAHHILDNLERDLKISRATGRDLFYEHERLVVHILRESTEKLSSIGGGNQWAKNYPVLGNSTLNKLRGATQSSSSSLSPFASPMLAGRSRVMATRGGIFREPGQMLAFGEQPFNENFMLQQAIEGAVEGTSPFEFDNVPDGIAKTTSEEQRLEKQEGIVSEEALVPPTENPSNVAGSTVPNRVIAEYN
ncbi:unnamed protein product, partial [Amoebophrya sp. A25]|eukprot:GSA25T00001177001.1